MGSCFSSARLHENGIRLQATVSATQFVNVNCSFSPDLHMSFDTMYATFLGFMKREIQEDFELYGSFEDYRNLLIRVLRQHNPAIQLMGEKGLQTIVGVGLTRWIGLRKMFSQTSSNTSTDTPCQVMRL